jgi:hypothetical protein
MNENKRFIYNSANHGALKKQSEPSGKRFRRKHMLLLETELERKKSLKMQLLTSTHC